MDDAQSEAASRPQTPRPQRITVIEDGRMRRLAWRWATWQTPILILFCIVWDSFLFFWYATAVASIADGKPVPLMMLVFPVLHVAAGVAMTYYAAASVINTTSVEVTEGEVRVHHGPLPWPGSRVLQSKQIDQVYCTEGGGWPQWSQRGRIVYKVQAAMVDGSSVDLLRQVPDIGMALYVEFAIEDQLGIEDRAVRGEVGRST